MRVVCLYTGPDCERREALAEACILFSPQVALGTDAVFAEVGASKKLFTEQEVIRRLQELLEVLEIKASPGTGAQVRIGLANDAPTALAFARYGIRSRDALPVEALACYLSPFSPQPFAGLEAFAKLGVLTIEDFMKIPRAEIPSRFGKAGLLAYERLLTASVTAWPRFTPPEKIFERVDFECAAQIETFEPVLFLLKSAFQRLFLRLYSRRLKLAAFEVKFHLNKFSSARDGIRDRSSVINLPLPQSDPKSVLALSAERLSKELELKPLEDSLEGVSLTVLDTAPFQEAQKDFFSRVEEETQAFASLVGRLEERLGRGGAFHAKPMPRLLPEASWSKTLDHEEKGTLVEVPLRPLRLLAPPQRLQRIGDWLLFAGRAGGAPCSGQTRRRWRFTSFTQVEKLQGEWWLGGFEREYFRVSTSGGETLWVYTESAPEGGPRALWLHGFFD